MHIAHVSRVAAVAAAKVFDRAFKHEDPSAAPAGRYRGAKSGVASANHQDIEDGG